MPVELRRHRGQLALNRRRSSLRALHDQEPVADHEDVVRRRHRRARLPARALASRDLLYAGLDRLDPITLTKYRGVVDTSPIASSSGWPKSKGPLTKFVPHLRVLLPVLRPD